MRTKCFCPRSSQYSSAFCQIRPHFARFFRVQQNSSVFCPIFSRSDFFVRVKGYFVYGRRRSKGSGDISIFRKKVKLKGGFDRGDEAIRMVRSILNFLGRRWQKSEAKDGREVVESTQFSSKKELKSLSILSKIEMSPEN